MTLEALHTTMNQHKIASVQTIWCLPPSFAVSQEWFLMVASVQNNSFTLYIHIAQ